MVGRRHDHSRYSGLSPLQSLDEESKDDHHQTTPGEGEMEGDAPIDPPVIPQSRLQT